MIESRLGQTIDIHGGGQDLRFPHHENEIAQSVCAHEGAPLARYWVHNGFLRMGTEKMSKSLGNIVLAHDLLKDWHGETIRWALLSAHYRQPLEWTEDLLRQSKRQLDRFYRLLEEIDFSDETDPPPESVILTLEKDLNTPEAYAGLHEMRDIAAQLGGKTRAAAIQRLRDAGRFMGFFNLAPEEWFKQGISEADKAKISSKVSELDDARAKKDYKTADRIRAAIELEFPVSVQTSGNVSVWVVKNAPDKE
jgi:cysteinyl-tRNA synthetase